MPNRFGLWLYTLRSVKHCNSSIKYAQRSFYLYGKVYVARSIDNVDAVAFPEAGGRSGSNGDTTFFFLFHPVHGSFTFVHLTDFVFFSGIKKNTLSSGSFTSIDVCHDTDIARFF
jgi:hypothetical protein